jgi:hypothetical protein
MPFLQPQDSDFRFRETVSIETKWRFDISTQKDFRQKVSQSVSQSLFLNIQIWRSENQSVPVPEHSNWRIRKFREI